MPSPPSARSVGFGARKLWAVKVPELLIPPSNVTFATETAVEFTSSKMPDEVIAPWLMNPNCKFSSKFSSVGSVISATTPTAIGLPPPSMITAGAEPN